MTIWEKIKDRWLTWRTGKNLQERTWEAWYDVNVVWRAPTIENTFMNFKHIIEVDPEKLLEMWHPFGYCAQESFKQYEYPQKALGENAVWIMRRVSKDQWDGRWHVNEIGGEDRVFVATNSDEDAVMIALKYK